MEGYAVGLPVGEAEEDEGDGMLPPAADEDEPSELVDPEATASIKISFGRCSPGPYEDDELLGPGRGVASVARVENALPAGDDGSVDAARRRDRPRGAAPPSAAVVRRAARTQAASIRRAMAERGRAKKMMVRTQLRRSPTRPAAEAGLNRLRSRQDEASAVRAEIRKLDIKLSAQLPVKMLRYTLSQLSLTARDSLMLS